MRTSRFVAIGFLVICGLIIAAVSNGLLDPAAPVAVFPTAVPRPTATPDPANSVTIELAYSSEKEAWLKQALDKWRATSPTVGGRLVVVDLQPLGSQEMVNQLADPNSTFRPTVVSPASTLQIAQINALTIDNQASAAGSPKSLVNSPLVIFAYNDTPADALVANEGLWTQIHDQVVVADRTKRLFFGQTAPDTSNSGLQTMLLMAATYHKRADLTTADINNSEFKTWLMEYTRNVAKFGASTGTFSEDIIRFGRSNYHAVAIYESLAIDRMNTAQGARLDPRILYPTTSMSSDHPYAILTASWVSAEQREAAEMFLEFLLSDEIQRDAVKLGFRPANPGVGLDFPESPFVNEANKTRGVRAEPVATLPNPAPEVVTALLDLWKNELQR